MIGRLSPKIDPTGKLLGGYYAYLMFQNNFKITDSQWDVLLKNGWFPFITLKDGTVSSMLTHVSKGWDTDDLLPQIQREVLERLPEALKSWANIKSYQPHMDFIDKAAEHLNNKDDISCISVIFPRIEGILREFQTIQGQPEKQKQANSTPKRDT
ncbi:MAG: hypothetical protein IH899_08125 [Planctomycetes bacterium]|nr:hypothetical protein [Planctomycetota bacterium]